MVNNLNFYSQSISLFEMRPDQGLVRPGVCIRNPGRGVGGERKHMCVYACVRVCGGVVFVCMLDEHRHAQLCIIIQETVKD